MLLPSFCIWSKVWFKQKAWSPRSFSGPTYSVVGVTHLPYTCFEYLWTSTHPKSTRILCSWAIANTAWMGQQGRADTHFAEMYLLYWCTCSIVLSVYLQNTHWKLKLLRISRHSQQSNKPRVWGFSEHQNEPIQWHRSHAHEASFDDILA